MIEEIKVGSRVIDHRFGARVGIVRCLDFSSDGTPCAAVKVDDGVFSVVPLGALTLIPEDAKNGVAIDPKNNYAYIANLDKTKVFKIDLITFTVSAILDIGILGMEGA